MALVDVLDCMRPGIASVITPEQLQFLSVLSGQSSLKVVSCGPKPLDGNEADARGAASG